MAAKDARGLREEAAVALAAGKHKRAIECYVELERLEPRDPQWPKRTAETYRKLNKQKEAIAAYERAAERYTQGGFMVQAIAVCKLILQLDPTNSDAAHRLANINESQGTGQTRIGALADSHPSLHGNEAVAALRERGVTASPEVESARIAAGRAADQAEAALELDRGPASRSMAGRPGTSPSGLAPRPSTVQPIRATTSPAAPPILDLELEPAPSAVRAAPRAVTAAPAPVARPVPVAAPARTRPPSGAPPIIKAGAPIVDLSLGDVIQGARDNRSDGSTPGVRFIPLEEEPPPSMAGLRSSPSISRPIAGAPPGSRKPLIANPALNRTPGGTPLPADDLLDLTAALEPAAGGVEEGSSIQIDIETLASDMFATEASDGAEPDLQLDAGDIEEPEELNLDDIEEMPLAAPRALSNSARRAMSETPLFAGLAPDALEALIERIELISVPQGEVLFREGDLGDALYIISEGQVAVQTEGPPKVEIGRLGEGAFFGEVALLTDQPRSASVTTLTPSELLKIDRDILTSLLADYPEVLTVVLRFVRDRLVERLVLTSPLFRPFDDGERRSLAARFRFLEIERGATVIPGGSKADGLYILLAGRLGTRRGGKPEMYGPGDLIGENSMLAGEKFEQPVESIGKALALCLPAAEFRELIMTHPHVLEYVGEQAEARRKVGML